MMTRHTACGSLLLFLVLGVLPASASAGPALNPYDRVIKRVVALLPKRAPQVVVFDASEARPDKRARLLGLDAFIVEESRVVYLVKQSALLERALSGSSPILDYMLAGVIWHEMAHLDGADEHAARKAEEALWTRFTRDGVCDQVTALRYLNTLVTRPDDTSVALN